MTATVKWVIAAAVILFTIVLAYGTGAESAREEAYAAGVASVTPPPTPTPPPIPTPRIVVEEVEVEVTPPECTDALLQAEAIIIELLEFRLDILSDYVDYPDENIAEFGRRIEERLGSLDPEATETMSDEYFALAALCDSTLVPPT